jgi:molybdenum cofactor cytidylyltransferase
MTGERIAGLVLAAGHSSRMGRNKMLLQLAGRSLVRRAVETAIAAGLDPVLAVVGHERERVEAELRGLRCVPIDNPEYAEGMNTSMRAGIRALPRDIAGAVLSLGDTPLIGAAMLRALVETFRRARPPLVISTYDGIVAPPILYGQTLFEELRALDPDAAGKSIVNAHRAEAIELSWPKEALTDLDAPEDLARVRARLEAA